MKRVTTLLFPVMALVLLFAGGCQVSPTNPTLTPEQRQAKNETTVRLAASLATKGALIAVNEKDAAETATVISQVAGDIVKVTANDTLDLTTVRQVAVQRIAAMNASSKQRLIATQLVDTIALLVQAQVDQAVIDGGDQRVYTIRLIRVAAEGAKDATLIFAE